MATQRIAWVGMVLLLAAGAGAQTAAGDKAAGQAKYQMLCTTCHGATGKGDGAAAAGLNPKPRDLSDAVYMKTRTDADLKKAILEGGAAIGKSPMMPPWKASLSDQDATNIVAYVRTFAAQAPAAVPAPVPKPAPAPAK